MATLSNEAIRDVAHKIYDRAHKIIDEDHMITADQVRRVVRDAHRAGEDVPQISSDRSIGMVIEELCSM